MDNIATLEELNRALARFCLRQEHPPTLHSAREIAQMSALAEYLHAHYDPVSVADHAAAAETNRRAA